MALGAVLAVLGVVLLAVFGWLVWPPLALVPPGVTSLAAGVAVDWEGLRGKSALPSSRHE